MPAAFALGAAMELFMIYVRIGNETFYETAKRLEQRRRDERHQSAQDLQARVIERRQQRQSNTPPQDP